MHQNISSSRLDMIAFCHQISRVSLVSSLSCSRYQDHIQQEVDMSPSLREEESKIIDRYSVYEEEKERGMDIYEVQQPYMHYRNKHNHSIVNNIL